MIRRPRATDHGDGSYRVAGMLLHMGGYWQLFVDVIVDDTPGMSPCSASRKPPVIAWWSA